MAIERYQYEGEEGNQRSRLNEEMSWLRRERRKGVSHGRQGRLAPGSDERSSLIEFPIQETITPEERERLEKVERIKRDLDDLFGMKAAWHAEKLGPIDLSGLPEKPEKDVWSGDPEGDKYAAQNLAARRRQINEGLKQAGQEMWRKTS